jgi:hypothetical protein
MSDRNEALISRALADESFRGALGSNLDRAATEYGLSQEEIAVLKQLDPAELDALAKDLESDVDSDCLTTGNCM